MLLSKAIEGFILDGLAGSYSPHTMGLYKSNLGIFKDYLGDVELSTITPEMLTDFVRHLRTSYIPRRNCKNGQKLSPSAVDNHWKCLRAFFGWCNRIMGLKRPDLQLPRMKFQLPEVVPLSEEQVKQLIVGCEFTTTAKTNGRKAFKMRRPTMNRDKALVLLLLDTGLRVGEVNRLKISDIDLSNGEVHVQPYGSGIKSRPRTVYLGKAARRSMWLYISGIEEARPDEQLFHINRANIRLLLFRLGQRVGVPNVYPHRFRHTFAIQYLRNGGDVFTLQRMMGHSNLGMVRKYLAIADTDSAEAHRKASPADRWRL